MAKSRRWTDEQFKQSVKDSTSYAQVIRKIGLKNYAGNYETVKKYIKVFSLDTSHFLGQAYLRGSNHSYSWKNRKPDDEVFVKNSDFARKALKQRIFEKGLIENKCGICNHKPFWKQKRLKLILDHKNGINNDNRLENLRFLCPNCNSQQPTFSRGKKKKNKHRYCEICAKTLSPHVDSNMCESCGSK